MAQLRELPAALEFPSRSDGCVYWRFYGRNSNDHYGETFRSIEDAADHFARSREGQNEAKRQAALRSLATESTPHE